MIIRQEKPSDYETVYTPLSITGLSEARNWLSRKKEDHTSFIVTIVA